VIRVEVIHGDDRRLAHIPVEEEVDMDELQELVGDGKGHVSVAMSYGDKDYGNGFEVRVSVGLTCNQDRDTIDNARSLALELAAEHLVDAKAQAEETYAELSRK
jgi:hypothetical protein